MESLTINNKKYDLAFNRIAIKYLGSKWNCPGTAAVINKMAGFFNPKKANKKANDQLTFDQEDAIVAIISACLIGGGLKPADLPGDDVIFKQIAIPGLIDSIVLLVQQSLPQMPDGAPDEKKTAK